MSPVSSSTMVNCSPAVERSPILRRGEPGAGEEPGARSCAAPGPPPPPRSRAVGELRAEEPRVVGSEWALVGGGGQVAQVDERVGEVDGGRLHLPLQQLVGVVDEELLQSVVAGDEDAQALALAPAGPAPLLPQAGHGARVADGDGRVEGADVDAQLQRAGADHRQKLPAEQLGLDAAALLRACSRRGTERGARPDGGRSP